MRSLLVDLMNLRFKLTKVLFSKLGARRILVLRIKHLKKV